jgi:predicted dehydrogenase
MGASLRFGILGTGWIARKFADDLVWAKGCSLTAAASRDIGKAREFAGACPGFPGLKAYGSYEELVASPDVDIVYVATPHNRHREDALLSLEAGKHVLVEKPLALNRTQAMEIKEAAAERGLFAMEALWTRFLPAATSLIERVRSGAIGEPMMAVADLSFRRDYDPASRLFDPALAGGSLLDVGIYPLTFAVMSAGTMPASACGLAHLCPTGVDDAASISLSFPGGMLASLSCGFRAEGHKDGILFGTKGLARLKSFWMSKGWEISRDGKVVDSWADPAPGMGYQFEAEHCAQCLAKGLTDSPVMPMEESCAMMGLMDGLRTSWGIRYPGE